MLVVLYCGDGNGNWLLLLAEYLIVENVGIFVLLLIIVLEVGVKSGLGFGGMTGPCGGPLYEGMFVLPFELESVSSTLEYSSSCGGGSRDHRPKTQLSFCPHFAMQIR